MRVSETPGVCMLIMKFMPMFLVLMALVWPQHSSAESSPKFKRTVEKYSVPDVTLVNQDGRKIRLAVLLNSGRPVLLDFIYGTCTTICPVLSAGFSGMQNKLGPESSGVQFISISIDPEHDTPEVMKDYLRRFRARPGWDFLTGSRGDINRVMKAFDAYVPNKMSHYPVTFLKAPNSSEWVRIYGMISMSVLMEEYRRLGER